MTWKWAPGIQSSEGGHLPLCYVDFPPWAGLEFLQVCQWSHNVVVGALFLNMLTWLLPLASLVLGAWDCLPHRSTLGTGQADGLGCTAGVGRCVCTYEHLLLNPSSGSPLPCEQCPTCSSCPGKPQLLFLCPESWMPQLLWTFFSFFFCYLFI